METITRQTQYSDRLPEWKVAKREYNRKYSKKRYNNDADFRAQEQLKYYIKKYIDNEDFDKIMSNTATDIVEKLIEVKIFNLTI